MRLCILYAYYAIYFMSMGPTANFAAIFYEEIGLNNTQIGLLTSLPVLLGMLALPVFGILSDNARRRRNVIALVLALCAGFSFLYDLTDRFALLMVICTGTALFSQPVLPLSGQYSSVSSFSGLPQCMQRGSRMKGAFFLQEAQMPSLEIFPHSGHTGGYRSVRSRSRTL